MSRLVFLLEERSTEATLNIILPKILPKNVGFQLIPHEGKSDLDSSIPRKLKAWNVPGDRFVILRDKDGADCLTLKESIAQKCAECGRPDTLVRIACHHLEAWFLGDLNAVGTAFSITGLADKQSGRKFRNPDLLSNASQELEKLVDGYQKVSGARAIAAYLDVHSERNRSRSFQVFIRGVTKMAKEIVDNQ